MKTCSVKGCNIEVVSEIVSRCIVHSAMEPDSPKDTSGNLNEVMSGTVTAKLVRGVIAC